MAPSDPRYPPPHPAPPAPPPKPAATAPASAATAPASAATAPASAATAGALPAANYATEQEKDAKAGGAASKDNIPGVGPATSTVEVVPAETIEEQGIGPRTPYPEGDPPPPHEETTRAQGIKTAKPASNEPNKPLLKERR
jgi:hypothetical protein